MFRVRSRVELFMNDCGREVMFQSLQGFLQWLRRVDKVDLLITETYQIIKA